MNLDDAQKALEAHFSALASKRATTPWPVFALEHPLHQNDIGALASALCDSLKGGAHPAKHWLAWVVFAAEEGYKYEGGVYWLPIEARSVPWDTYRRRQLRNWFNKFQSTYNGVSPSGPWAEAFTIIAWPITHAVLPQFQRLEFCRSLYDMRYALARVESLAPAEIGGLFAQHAWNTSSRFREFLQQEELVGRLVLSVLGDRDADVDASPIYLPTLERLVGDLETTNISRQWLDVTRRHVSDRFKGAFHIARGDAAKPTSRPDAGAPRQPEPDVRPTLLLRPTGRDKWSIIAELPCLAGIASLNAELKTFVNQTRCKVRGATDTWLPAGWLSDIAQRRRLDDWPGHEPLISFERKNAALEQILATDCRLSDGDTWLCRVQADGLAHEVRSRRIRPGGRYILLTSSPLPTSSFSSACAVDCKGIHATLLKSPTSFSNDDLKFFKHVGLDPVSSLQISPAGLVVSSWDGEGYGEWFTNDEPCFALSHDHPVHSYRIRLNNNGWDTFSVDGAVVLVALPRLEAGLHALTVTAVRADETEVTGFVTLRIRENDPWRPGATVFNGIVAELTPADATLDTLWDEGVQLQIMGPEGHQVTANLTLRTAAGAELLNDTIGAFDLPVSASTFAKALGDFLRDGARARKLLEASSGELTFGAAELGQKQIRLERALRAIHWLCHSSTTGVSARVLDETGSESPTLCRRYDFGHPDSAVVLDLAEASTGFEIRGAGGMLVAEQGAVRDAVIVSPPFAGDLRALAVDPVFDDTASAVGLVTTYKEWHDARATSSIASLRRAHILMRALDRFYWVMCGSQWFSAEQRYLQNPSATNALRDLEKAVAREPGFPVSLRRNHAAMMRDTTVGVRWFEDTAKLYRVTEDLELPAIALRIASEPEFLLTFASGDQRDNILQRLASNDVLMRGARMVAVMDTERNPTNRALPRWQW